MKMDRTASIIRENNYDFNGVHNAVIYRIWNKNSGKSYIGKTTQAFTLRWYQHVFQSKGTKFHEELRNSKLSDWAFEVVEEFDFKCGHCESESAKILSEREQYWIEKYNAVKDGLNTATANKFAKADNLFGV